MRCFYSVYYSILSLAAAPCTEQGVGSGGIAGNKVQKDRRAKLYSQFLCLILLNYSQGFRQIIFSAKRPVKTKQMWRFRRIFILPLNICRSFQPRPGPNSMRHFDFYSIHIFNNVGSDQNKLWC